MRRASLGIVSGQEGNGDSPTPGMSKAIVYQRRTIRLPEWVVEQGRRVTNAHRSLTQLLNVRALGIGLAVAVLLHVLIVRRVLLPAVAVGGRRPPAHEAADGN